MKALIVVDMQKDFITGPLGSPEAEAAIPHVIEAIAKYCSSGTILVATRDTHYDNYMKTQEGQKLPVPHCIEGSKGWMYDDEVAATIMTYLPLYGNFDDMYMCDVPYIDKPTFGSIDLLNYFYNIKEADGKHVEVDEFILCGLVTNMCVLNNAILLKAAFPEANIKILSQACAGTSPEKHQQALDIMSGCHIEIV